VSYVNDLVDEEHTDWLFIARDEPASLRKR
jgi:hypothetical protein